MRSTEALDETAKITKTTVIGKIKKSRNFAGPLRKSVEEMQMR